MNKKVLSLAKVNRIKRLLEKGMSGRAIALKLGIGPHLVFYIKNPRRHIENTLRWREKSNYTKTKKFLTYQNEYRKRPYFRKRFNEVYRLKYQNDPVFRAYRLNQERDYRRRKKLEKENEAKLR